MLQYVIAILERDLDRLAAEITLFKNDRHVWQLAGNISNTSGNLCLHLLGNINTYIGKHLGNTGYIRNREAEFTLKDVPNETLIAQIHETKRMVRQTLEALSEEDLQKIFPEKTLGYEMSTGYFLVHITSHLSYHLGQINYLRRMLSQ